MIRAKIDIAKPSFPSVSSQDKYGSHVVAEDIEELNGIVRIIFFN